MRQILLLLSFTFLLGAFPKFSNVIKIEPIFIKKNKQIYLNLFIADGYGLQKGPLHKINLYSLSKKHKTHQRIIEKIKKNGYLIQTKKQLSGITSTQNKKYFSSLNPIIFKGINNYSNDYAVQGKLFYCSFEGAFCSVQTFEKIIIIPKNIKIK